MTEESCPLSEKERMEEILRRESIGHLAMAGGGELYLIPINYTYATGGRILFHCAPKGRKLDMIRANPAVCFEVSSQEGEPVEHGGRACDAPFESVICWGRARVVDDLAERQRILQEFQVRYATPEKPRESLGLDRAEGCGCVEITVTRMTGRRAQAQDSARWFWEE
jgi:nitroimidazol reductase NimA-like FMN-containing flavoprotein (pyridoxamine 5'-phosphate oxidase superfamily)